jgi:hypothetical protein
MINKKDILKAVARGYTYPETSKKVMDPELVDAIADEIMTLLISPKKDEDIHEHSKDIGREQEMLISFESGHYKKVKGKWKGDSIWTHWIKPDGKAVHINKDKVEYYEEL